MAKTNKPKSGAILWLSRQQAEDSAHAGEYLALVFPAAAAKKLSARLAGAKVVIHPAKNIVRAGRITPLPATNARVAHDLNKIARGRKLPPILLVRGDAARDLPLIVADGMHRLSAAWHHDESADVACVIADRPKG
jgi:hypothetical protein